MTGKNLTFSITMTVGTTTKDLWHKKKIVSDTIKNHNHTPSTMSSTSFRAGPAGERKPELSTTQLDRLISPEVESASVPGLILAFGGVTALDGPASFVTLMVGASGADLLNWRESQICRCQKDKKTKQKENTNY